MTRINLIEPRYLTNRHLIAEFKEILQLLGQLKKMTATPELLDRTLSRVPEEFCLGTGHVTFWANKLQYIHDRWISLENEMRVREFNPRAQIDLSEFPNQMKGQYRPTNEAIKTVRKRIQCRVLEKPHLYPDAVQRGWRIDFKERRRKTIKTVYTRGHDGRATKRHVLSY